MKNRSTIYWKCQFAGWSLYYGQQFIVNLTANFPVTQWDRVLNYVSAILFSIFLSHKMKNIIVRNGVSEKPLFKRAVTLIFYSIIAGFLFKAIEIVYELYVITDPGRAKSLSQLLSRSLRFQIIDLYFRIFSFVEWNICYQLVYYIYKIRNDEIAKLKFEKKIIEYESKALRSQMNPHFIFNSLNSIKSLMQQNRAEKAITYLTIFSKHLRTILRNTDNKEITLFDEIETCKLYLQLEAMRLEGRFSYEINIDETIDMKSIKIPALIIQPFIENAIWHGIIPKGSKGNIELCVAEKGNDIVVIIEDDGIGMDSSKNNKTGLDISHESKGLSLTEERLKLDNFLRQRNARLDISELKDNAGMSLGTRIILTIKKEL